MLLTNVCGNFVVCMHTIILTGRPAALFDKASVDWAPSCMLPVSQGPTKKKKRKTSSVCESACVSVQDAATQCDIVTTSSVGTQCLIQPRTANKSKFLFLDTILFSCGP